MLGAIGVTRCCCAGDPSCSRFCTCTCSWDEHPWVAGCKLSRKGEDMRGWWDLLALHLQRGTLPCWHGVVNIWVQHAAPWLSWEVAEIEETKVGPRVQDCSA